MDEDLMYTWYIFGLMKEQPKTKTRDMERHHIEFKYAHHIGDRYEEADLYSVFSAGATAIGGAGG